MIHQKKSRGHRSSKIVKSTQSPGNGHLPYHLFILWVSARAHGWRGMWICVRSKDAQKQLARTSLSLSWNLVGTESRIKNCCFIDQRYRFAIITFWPLSLLTGIPLCRAISTTFVSRTSLATTGTAPGSITSRCFGKWARAHPPQKSRPALLLSLTSFPGSLIIPPTGSSVRPGGW